MLTSFSNNLFQTRLHFNEQLKKIHKLIHLDFDYAFAFHIITYKKIKTIIIKTNK